MQTVIFTKIIFSQKITEKFDTLEMVLICLQLHEINNHRSFDRFSNYIMAQVTVLCYFSYSTCANVLG